MEVNTSKPKSLVFSSRELLPFDSIGLRRDEGGQAIGPTRTCFITMFRKMK